MLRSRRRCVATSAAAATAAAAACWLTPPVPLACEQYKELYGELDDRKFCAIQISGATASFDIDPDDLQPGLLAPWLRVSALACSSNELLESRRRRLAKEHVESGLASSAEEPTDSDASA